MKPVIYNEPSLAHLNTKLFAYMIICVLIGIALSVLFPSFNEDDKINRMRRPAQTTRVVIRGLRPARTTRRKAA